MPQGGQKRKKKKKKKTGKGLYICDFGEKVYAVTHLSRRSLPVRKSRYLLMIVGMGKSKNLGL